MKVIESRDSDRFDVGLDKDLLAKNKSLARKNRKKFDRLNILAIEVMGSIGCGKTSFLKAILKKLKMGKSVGVIAGDLTTTIDANLIRQAINKMKLDGVKILFIENVGNLICPGEFPLGTHKRVVVTSVTEGPYMIVKPPLYFQRSRCDCSQ